MAAQCTSFWIKYCYNRYAQVEWQLSITPLYSKPPSCWSKSHCGGLESDLQSLLPYRQKIGMYGLQFRARLFMMTVHQIIEILTYI
jgi:hypothetical protein